MFASFVIYVKVWGSSLSIFILLHLRSIFVTETQGSLLKQYNISDSEHGPRIKKSTQWDHVQIGSNFPANLGEP